MRKTILRHTVTACGLVALLSAVVTGCGDSDKDSGGTSSAPAATSAQAVASSSQTTKAITDAYVTFFDGKAPAATRAGLVERGSAFQPALEGMSGNPQAQGTSVTVAAVKVGDADHADVTYTLLLNGAPVLPDQTGQAVREAGQWKVAAATFCALLAIQGGGGAGTC